MCWCSPPLVDSLTFTGTQTAQIPGWITEASTLIEGYLRHTYTADETVPDAARIVCARVVARALTTPVTTPNADRYDSTMGPFTASTQMTRDALGGGVWLTRQDKMALDSIPGGGLTNRSMIPLKPCPPAPPNWWLMTPAPGG